MSKLFKLKSWLTLQEASEQLSAIFEEKVKPKDVLKLALDGQLQMSVYFPHPVYAKKYGVVPLAEAKKVELPQIIFIEGRPALSEQGTMQLKGFELGDGNVLQIAADQIFSIDGLWDLPMIGAERLDVEFEHLQKIGGAELELISLNGTYVRSASGDYLALQAYEPEQIEIDETKTKAHSENNPNNKTKSTCIKKYRAGYYYPLDSLPEDAMLVVRPSSISALIDQVTADSIPKRQSAESKEVLAIDSSEYWRSLSSKINKAIKEYPEWSSKQRSIAKSGNLQEWLIGNCNLSTRECEIAKKVMTDILNIS